MTMLVGEHLRLNAARVPAKTALIDAERRVTYAELAALAHRIAHALAAEGVRGGDRIGILAAARVEWVAAYLLKIPKRVVFLPYAEMPINYSGKILKRELRRKLLP